MGHNMKTSKEKITAKALKILKSNPNGIRYSELVRKIQGEFQSTSVNTIRGIIWNLDICEPKQIYKPARGLFRHTIFRGKEVSEESQEFTTETERINESDFYKPFADWLVGEMEECTKAIPLGGNRFKDKWGTPDVIGIREPLRSDIVKPPPQITSAEIKSDTKDLITAFGQACSYKLFSHKSYIVIPKNSSEDDVSKLDALCLIFGIGLVLFDNTNVNDPHFEIRVRPIKQEPDMFYVNKYMKYVEKDLWS